MAGNVAPRASAEPPAVRTKRRFIGVMRSSLYCVSVPELAGLIDVAQWSKIGSSDDRQITRWYVMAWNGEAETAGERVYRRLRNDIISGRLEPSEKLKLGRLKDDYGI